MMAPAISLKQVTKNFGMTGIIQGVDLDVWAGERHAIIGPNGAGKSTLFDLISGKHAITDGKVYLHGTDITGMAPYEISRLGLSRSFQVTNIFPRLSVFENVRSALLWSQGCRYSFWHLIDRQMELNAAADAVLGKFPMTGRLPISIPGFYAYGHRVEDRLAGDVALPRGSVR